MSRRRFASLLISLGWHLMPRSVRDEWVLRFQRRTFAVGGELPSPPDPDRDVVRMILSPGWRSRD